MSSNAKNVSIWWRHHGNNSICDVTIGKSWSATSNNASPFVQLSNTRFECGSLANTPTSYVLAINIEAGANWSPSCRGYIKVSFKKKLLYPDANSTEVCFQKPNWRWTIIGFDKANPPNRGDTLSEPRMDNFFDANLRHSISRRLSTCHWSTTTKLDTL